MKDSGIIRKVDELGRIVIPKEVRKSKDIKEKDELEFFIDGNKILLKKTDKSCCICSKETAGIKYRDKLICNECMEEIVRLKNK